MQDRTADDDVVQQLLRGLPENLVSAIGQLHKRAAAEIGRLRVALRVNGLRAGATDAEIDEVIHGKR